jgi:hypothetical protein
MTLSVTAQWGELFLFKKLKFQHKINQKLLYICLELLTTPEFQSN